jgi:hypothetical protein
MLKNLPLNQAGREQSAPALDQDRRVTGCGKNQKRIAGMRIDHVVMITSGTHGMVILDDVMIDQHLTGTGGRTGTGGPDLGMTSGGHCMMNADVMIAAFRIVTAIDQFCVIDVMIAGMTGDRFVPVLTMTADQSDVLS